ncbi:beta-N-acetylhexosaminidase [Roseomonas sp. OT10]|uniref:glycoside hydrolase family 3 N-terminal domain-containing protein n=1 Tax=Roseomonas cutis TaxID=2897332 RepID=UPI001E404456|nr:glycoside hydrolase family 3 N-terminal domain-containing protein [Roseomonas sp. OT10]UFN50735.1 beta-N-acetylhexosaminidase [Roseomonas sp. OT10]
MSLPRAAILGIAGPALTAEEAALFRRTPPAGAILFARNVVDPAQLLALTASLRELLGEEAPILVDQEGGRVARLRPPHWPAFPPPAQFEGDAEGAAANAARLGAACAAMGLDVVCAPVLDLRLPGAHGIVGDRGLSADPAEVARLGAAWIGGLRTAGCVPVIKHIPGHGRALLDSHEALPRIGAGEGELEADLFPFQAVCQPDRGRGVWAMTAHLLYEAWDAERPATLSPIIVESVIRQRIGFDGPLVSDDLAMKALSGTPAGLAVQALAAGCDLALHCTGVLAENAALLAACPPMTDRAAERLAEARAVALESRRPAAA